MLRSELAHDTLSDLRLTPARRADAALALDRRATAAGWDLDTQRDADAIGQAAWLCLAVPRGALAPLGHPDFGSRLHLLIGALLTEQTMNRARAYIREALRDDPRFRVLEITLARSAADPGALDARVVLEPGGALSFPLAALISGADAGAGGSDGSDGPRVQP